MTRIFGILIAVLFLSVGHTASAQDSSELLKKAQDGDAEAQYNLGVCLLLRRGVEQDYAEAVKWDRLAAEQGHAVRNTILVLPTPTAKVLSKTTLKRSSGGA